VTDLRELKVPKALRQLVEEIVGITDAVCLCVLDGEYADLARLAVAKLARKRPSPLVSGRPVTWAAGIVYALGQTNFLSDPESDPCVTADQLSEAFGVAKSTMGSKAKQVRDLLRISPFSLEFQRADVAAQNQLVWIIEVDGIAMDARHVPLAIQMEAYRRGLIPYVPTFGPDGKAPCEDSPVAGLLERSRELKRQLVGFARSPRFSRELDLAVGQVSRCAETNDAEFTNLVDHFILQRPLADGRTVVEIFAAEHPEFAETDRQILLRWREVVEGVFQVREQTADAILAVDLVDERTYRIRSNAGLEGLAPIRPGVFMIARIVPLGGDWMLSGAQMLYPASERAAMLCLAVERSVGESS
jgi:hypothetical protein